MHYMEIFKNKINKFKKTILRIINSIPKSIIGLIFSIIVLVSPLLENVVTRGHDYVFHATNLFLTHDYINIFKLNLLLPKIFGGTIANGFGYGTGLFYPPLSYYLTSYISYFLNYSNNYLYLSITILEIITIALSGIFMYIFLKRVFKDNNIAGIGSISYISSTYFLCDIYTRCATAEMLTFIFIPLIFLGLYKLFFGDKKRFDILFTVGYIGMINSHLVLTIYLTIIIIILFLCFPRKVFKKDIIKKLVLSSIIILFISSPYLVPLLEHKILGNYVVFIPYGMYTDYWISENTISLNEFWTIGTKANDITVYINYIVLITSIITITFNKTIFKKEQRKIYIITIILILISAFISSSYFMWDKAPDFLKMIQFPWRLCGITSFGIAVLAGNIIKLIKGDNKSLIISFLAIGILLFGYNTINHEKIMSPSELKNMSMGAEKEYLPVNTKYNINYFNNRTNNIIVKDGEAEFNVIKNNTPYLNSEIKLNSDEVVIELPRIYYLGYKIELTDNKGNKETIKYYENENGFIELKLKKSGVLEVSYEGTMANNIANYICLITIIICISTLTYKKYKRKK